MNNFVQTIKDQFAKYKPKDAQKRKEVYNNLRKILKEKTKNKTISEAEKEKLQKQLEQAIADTELEYRLVTKILVNPNSETTLEQQKEIVEKTPLKETVPPPKQSAKEVKDSSKNPISKLIIETKRSFERAQRRQKYIHFFKIFIGIFIIFIAFFAIFLAFFSDSSFFSHKEKPSISVTSQISDAQNFNKLTYRLTPNGTEVKTILPKQDFKKDQISKENFNKNFLSDQEFALSISYPLKQNQAIPSFLKLFQDKAYQKNKMEWNLSKQQEAKTDLTDYKIEGNLYLDNLKATMHFQIYANQNPDINAAYLMEINFIFQNQNTTPFIKQLLDFTTQDNFDNKGQSLESANPTMVGKNYFIYAFKKTEPFLKNDLKALRNAHYFGVKMLDEKNNVYDIFFSKGQKGEMIFQEALDSWMNQKK